MNKTKKLSLVSIHLEKSPRAVPLGAAMIASALKKNCAAALDIEITEFYLNQAAAECASQILKNNPDFAGFSVYMWNRSLFADIAAILKKQNPSIVIFAGGPETLCIPEVDFIIPGEGEDNAVAAVKMLLAGRSTAEITGCITERKIQSLESLDSPYLDKTLDLKNYRGVLWELSRGCPFKCDFCFESRGTAGVRTFPLERLEEELRLFKSSGIRQIFVLDPTFNANKDRAKKILSLIKKTAADIHFTIEARAEFIDPETALLFSEILCSLQIGLQSSDVNVLKNINRIMDPQLFRGKILMLHEAGVTYGFDLIYGLPGDTLSGFMSSIDYALSLAPNHVDIFPLAVLPGTRLKENAPHLDLIYSNENPYHVISSALFSEKDMAIAAFAAEACDLFYNRGKAVPWFLTVLENLDIPPSGLIREFAVWLERKKIDPSGINCVEKTINIQIDFLTDIITGKNRREKIKITSDLIKWFGFTSALMENETLPEDCSTIITGFTDDHQKYKLNPELYLTAFNYDIENLIETIENGITDFYEASLIIPETAEKTAIYISDGELNTQYLSDIEYEFLETIRLGAAAPVLNREIKPFISDALQSGILQPC